MPFPICFIICPIGEDGSEIRKQSDTVLKHIIAPVVKACNYEPLRADQIPKPGIITSQIIRHIVEDPMLIADLSGHNPNVFYELAIRHAIQKPFVQIIQKGNKIPFDVIPIRTIIYDLYDLDSVENAKYLIEEQIKSFEGASGNIDTPISIALDAQILRQIEERKEKLFVDFNSKIDELRQSIEETLRDFKAT